MPRDLILRSGKLELMSAQIEPSFVEKKTPPPSVPAKAMVLPFKPATVANARTVILMFVKPNLAALQVAPRLMVRNTPFFPSPRRNSAPSRKQTCHKCEIKHPQLDGEIFICFETFKCIITVTRLAVRLTLDRLTSV